MEKPTVFVFTTAYHPFAGGAEIAVEEITRRLAGDFEFFIITARLRPGLPRREVRPEGVVIRIGFGTPFDKALLPLWGTLYALALSRTKPPALSWGVMVSYASGIPYLANLLRPWRRAPVLLTLQEGDSEAHIRSGRFGIIGLAWRTALARTDELTAISRYLERLARRFGYRGPAAVIPNGVDLGRFGRGLSDAERLALRAKLGIAPHERVIVTASRLEEKNAVDVTIRALRALAARGVPAKLLVLGEGSRRRELEALAGELGVRERVLFRGSVPYAEVPRHLAIADAFCRPSRSEGLGSAFLEAMAAGLPVVATPVGGIPDFLRDGENGLFSRVDDPDDLAATLALLLGDQELRARLAANGRKTVSGRYEWDGIARSFRRIFERLTLPRILIATPFFPPAIGGPARYAAGLARTLTDRTVPVSVISYGTAGTQVADGRIVFVSPKLPSGIKHFAYFFKALRLLRRLDLAIVLDPVIVGMPVLLACRLLAKPFVLRFEGDFLWESYAARTRHDLTLREFAESLAALTLSAKERIVWRLARAVLRRAKRAVFSSAWRREITEREYRTGPLPAVVMGTAWPSSGRSREEREPVILYAGRFIWIKNLERLIRAFVSAAPPGWRLELVGDGPECPALERLVVELDASGRVIIRSPLSPAELRKRIASVRAFVLPSLSDVSPNVILECLAAGTPFLLTRESGFAEALAEVGLLVDPLDEENLTEKLRMMFDETAYAEIRERLRRSPHPRSWDAVADDWLTITRQTLSIEAKPL